MLSLAKEIKEEGEEKKEMEKVRNAAVSLLKVANENGWKEGEEEKKSVEELEEEIIKLKKEKEELKKEVDILKNSSEEASSSSPSRITFLSSLPLSFSYNQRMKTQGNTIVYKEYDGCESCIFNKEMKKVCFLKIFLIIVTLLLFDLGIISYVYYYYYCFKNIL